MLTKITKSCSVRMNGDVKKLQAGETITLPADKAQRIIDAGYAEPAKPGIDEYRDLTCELAKRDPKGDCWGWLLQCKPETWRGFMLMFKNGDLAGARKRFDEMITAWKDQNTKEMI